MQKKILAAAVAALCTTALPALAQQASGSKVQLWGIVDTAVRHTNNEGPTQSSRTQMVGGGMSQSRWGIKVEEDLGGGSKALVELENRFTSDDGVTPVGNTPFFQLAHVGLQGGFGRLTMGRQWNVLFDVVTSTYASFPYSPYMDAFKPELGMAAGARNSNMLKYTFATPSRNFVGSLQYSFDENSDTTAIQNAGAAAYMAGAATGGAAGGMQALGNFQTTTMPGMVSAAAAALKTYGGFLRYSQSGFSVGGGYLRTELPGGSDLDAWTLGGSYRGGPLYVNVGYGYNEYKRNTSVLPGALGPITTALRNGTDTAIVGNMWSGQTNGGFQPGDANEREMYKVGFGYQVTPQLNAGLHYFHAKQKGSATGRSNGKADFMIAAVDYAFSKRTDAYFAVDHTKLSGGADMFIDVASRATKRTGITTGIRHRF